MPNPRTIVYIDGFNLYYGSLKHTKYKWLNLERLFKLLRPHDDLIAIKYFTAPVRGSAKIRQSTYFEALSTSPIVEIILGRFKKTKIQCVCSGCANITKSARSFYKWEEKRTDVAIAIEMLDDAYQDNCDQIVLVSGDSDLVPPVSRTKQRFPNMKIIVYVPFLNANRGAAVELRNAADNHKQLPVLLIKHSQFPATLHNPATGHNIQKPSGW